MGRGTQIAQSRHWGDSGGSRGHGSRPIPVDSHRTHCIPAAAVTRTQVRWFLLWKGRRGHGAFLCWVHAKLPGSWKEAGVRYKPRCLSKSVSHRRSFSSGNGGNAPAIHISRPQPRASLACEQVFLKSVLLFLHSPLPWPKCLYRRSASSFVVLGPHSAGESSLHACCQACPIEALAVKTVLSTIHQKSK